ncbi:MAG: hypothetical protein MJA82_04970 [Clostridia bacterium]|nr:hypothetical protein [Clostridia bacterium]
MPGHPNELFQILKSETFLNLINSDKIKIAELNAAITLLIKCNIDFDVIFEGATTREFPEAILTIFINPNTNLDFRFRFNNCR